nr:RYamide receptor-like [Dermatophagoides farinae]
MDHRSMTTKTTTATTTTITTTNTTNTMPLEALEYPYQVFLITLYSLTALFAFISNFLTIIVMINGKRCIGGDMRKFIINLSITDLLMAIFTIPFTYTNYMLGRWIFIAIMCPIVNCAQLTTITVSIYTLVAIAIDRYMAIMYPLRKSISWFKRHRTFIVILIWIFGICLGISQIFVTETDTFEHNGHKYISCDERWKPESIEGRLYTIFIFATTFAIPMSAFCIIYTAMGWKIFRYQGPEYQLRLQSLHNHFHHQNNNEIQKKIYNNDDDVVDVDDDLTKRIGHIDYHYMIKNKNDIDTNAIDSDANICLKSCNNKNNNNIVPSSNHHLIQCVYYETKNQSLYTTESIQTKYCINNNNNKFSNLNGHNNNNNHHHYYQLSNHHPQTIMTTPHIAATQINSNKIMDPVNHRSTRFISNRRHKILKILITIIGVFTICWLPIQLFNILIYFKRNFLHVDSAFKYYAFVGSYFFCHWISMAHSFMNPIIYSFMSKNFRSDLRIILTKFWNNWKKYNHR